MSMVHLGLLFCFSFRFKEFFQGETTSHIIGMFYRTIRMVDNGLKPLYVFDGM